MGDAGGPGLGEASTSLPPVEPRPTPPVGAAGAPQSRIQALQTVLERITAEATAYVGNARGLRLRGRLAAPASALALSLFYAQDADWYGSDVLCVVVTDKGDPGRGGRSCTDEGGSASATRSRPLAVTANVPIMVKPVDDASAIQPPEEVARRGFLAA